MHKTIVAFAAVAALAVAGQAAAHARLLMGSPKAGETVAAPKEIRLQYSESIVPAASSVAVSGPNGAAVAAGPIALDAKDQARRHRALHRGARRRRLQGHLAHEDRGRPRNRR